MIHLDPAKLARYVCGDASGPSVAVGALGRPPGRSRAPGQCASSSNGEACGIQAAGCCVCDEVLDYRLALEAFGKENCIIREGGNHNYENYELELPHIFDFLLSRINLARYI